MAYVTWLIGGARDGIQETVRDHILRACILEKAVYILPLHNFIFYEVLKVHREAVRSFLKGLANLVHYAA